MFTTTEGDHLSSVLRLHRDLEVPSVLPETTFDVPTTHAEFLRVRSTGLPVHTPGVQCVCRRSPSTHTQTNKQSSTGRAPPEPVFLLVRSRVFLLVSEK